MRLDQYDNKGFERGKPRWVEACWIFIHATIFSSWIPGSRWRVNLLRWFGADVGTRVVVKPNVRIKFPWRLSVGDDSWIGEGVWIDNLAQVTIGSHCCISQGVYMCTGSHRWDLETFDLETLSIVIEDQVWVGARSNIAPGSVLKEGCVLTIGASAHGILKAGFIYSGSPAEPIKSRGAKQA